MAERDQSIYVQNDRGAVALATSLFLYVQRPDEDSFEEVGVAMKFTTSESRNILYNYVIGNGGSSANAKTATPRDLIPQVIQSSTLSISSMALFKTNILAVLGDTEGLNWLSSIRYQNRPFKLKEQFIHPNTSKTREIWYEGCFIERYERTQELSAGSDIRLLEDVTVHFRDVQTRVDDINADN